MESASAFRLGLRGYPFSQHGLIVTSSRPQDTRGGRPGQHGERLQPHDGECDKDHRRIERRQFAHSHRRQDESVDCIASQDRAHETEGPRTA